MPRDLQAASARPPAAAPWIAFAAAFLLGAAGLAAGPQVTIVEPKEGGLSEGPVTVKAAIEPGDGATIDQVIFYVDGKIAYVDREPPWEHRFNGAGRFESHTYKVVALDSAGAIGEATLKSGGALTGFRSEVSLVVLNLTALDTEGRFIGGLGAEEIKIYEDDVEQEIKDFSTEVKPLVVGIAIDTSGSMIQKIQRARDAAATFIRALAPNDQAFVMSFDSAPNLLQDFTSNQELLTLAVQRTQVGGATVLYDALSMAIERLRGLQGVKRALVVLSDGMDYGSRTKYQEVIALAKRSEVIIYSVGLSGSGIADLALDENANHATTVLKSIAEQTGGFAMFPSNLFGLEDIYRNIAATLRSQYFITYTSRNQARDGKWRRIELACSRPAVTKLLHRQGYYAPMQN
jgi:Ca-activated chloride channel family protein